MRVLKKLSEILETDEVYLVGGPVRDMLLGKTPKDYDVASPLRPEEVMRRAREKGVKVIPTGIRYGTVTLLLDGEPVEHTTFRKEHYRDDRHPEVKFTDRIEDDLARRDFTINAMAMDKDGRIVDPFGGKKDLEKGVIRAVGDPEERFYEDPLRVMRLARFAARYGFEMDAETFFAARHYADQFDPDNPEKRVSTERISEELKKGIKQSRDPAEYFNNLRAVGALDRMFKETLAKTYGVPQQPKYHRHDVYTHSMEVARNVKKFTNVDPRTVERTKEIYRSWLREYEEWKKRVTAEKERLPKPYLSTPPPSLYEAIERELGDVVEKNLEASILKALVEETYGTPVNYDEDILVLAAALHDVGKGIMWGEVREKIIGGGKWTYACHDKRGYLAVKNELRRLKMSNREINEISRLVLAHDIKDTKKPLYRYLKYITRGGNYDLIAKALILRKADALAHREPLLEAYRKTLRTVVDSLPTAPLTAKKLAIRHSDVVDLVKKYYDVTDAAANVIAGEILRRIEMDTFVYLHNHPVDLRWRAEQLAAAHYREPKRMKHLLTFK